MTQSPTAAVLSAAPGGGREAPTKTVRVVAALIWRSGRILIQQRSPHGSRPMLWEFPGGKVERGESDATALRRECREELGVTVDVRHLAWETDHRYDDIAVHLLLYAADLPEDATPEPRQAVQIAWRSPAELAGLRFCEADVPVVRDLAAGRILSG